jgi:ABC-2 type transport system ATP-binding protein
MQLGIGTVPTSALFLTAILGLVLYLSIARVDAPRLEADAGHWRATTLIDADHIKLRLNDGEILRDVSLHLSGGEIYGLLGPNGAGKSTTIAVLLGLYPASGGTLRLFGDAPADPKALRRRIGVMPERAGCYGWMTATDYLVWYAGFYGGLQQPVPDLLRSVGLQDSARTPIAHFSHGMQQRLSLARGLVHGPELLILNEPTNGLDPRGRREIHDLLVDLARERRVGVLLCTHLLDDVERLCSRVGLIDGGRTVAEGTLSELVGETHAKLRYRLRVTGAPPPGALPQGVELLTHEGEWLQVAVAADAMPGLAGLWGDRMARGWGLTEIHAEAGGLEALYLRLTAEGRGESWEAAA